MSFPSKHLAVWIQAKRWELVTTVLLPGMPICISNCVGTAIWFVPDSQGEGPVGEDGDETKQGLFNITNS